jgi:hypothetical protein
LRRRLWILNLWYFPRHPPPALQSSPPVDPLQPLAFLIGRWEGTSEGQPGSASVRREYTRILSSRFIRVQNQSVYKPQAKNPKGETHEDETYVVLSRDEFEEIFELAEPGTEFELYSRVRLKRVS